MTIKYSIFFTDHLGVKKKINIDNIVDLGENLLEISNKKLYATFAFVTNGVYYKPDIVGDLVERIEFRYKINNKEKSIKFSINNIDNIKKSLDNIIHTIENNNNEKSIKFVIDSIEYLPHNNIKVYCKTKGIKYSYKYSGVLNETIATTSLKDLLDQLIDLPKNYDNLTDVPFYFDYEIKNKSIEEVIADLSQITMFDYYFKDGIIYFEDKKVIKKDDTAIIKFSEIDDILSFSTSTNKDDKKINKIVFNKKEKDLIIAEPSILLDIKDSPQCCSPDEVKIYTDENGNTYKINPVNAFYLVYYSPLIKDPEINLNANKGEKIVVEEFKLENDEFVRVAGGIKELIAIEGVSNYTYQENYNVIAFDKVDKGELKVTYKTDVLYGTIEHSKYPKTVNITIKHFNQIIDYDHKIELNGYYPVPFDFTLNLIKDWGLDPAEAINQNVIVSKKNGDVFEEICSYTSNAFGELNFTIDDYGVYKFEKENAEPLYLSWFINKKEIYMDEIGE